MAGSVGDMTMPPLLGIETEFGVHAPSEPGANPMLLSSRIVHAYRALAEIGGRTRWDYDDEDPLADARGFRLQRAAAHPSQLTDEVGRAARHSTIVESDRPTHLPYEDPGAANLVLTNGGRLYVDHAHPEYSSPEVSSARDAVVWDKAGELIVLAAAREAASSGVGPDITLYKNNVDGKGASYGTHENYLMTRDVPFDAIARSLIPFLATRAIYSGAGRVGLGQAGREAGFQISQRADYIEAEVGLETTLKRPIVNTRDEPHADPQRYRRLHLIIGDATMSEIATYLKVGTTALVIQALETWHAAGAEGAFVDLDLADAVGTVHAVSRDLSLGKPLLLADGRTATAIDIQRAYLERAVGLVELSDEQRDIARRWGEILTQLQSDPMECYRQVEWVAKLRLMEAMRRRDSLAWDHPRLATMDVQWSDVRPERGLYHRLVAADGIDRLVTDREIREAVDNPPTDTRAYFRGEAMKRYAADVSAASWDCVIFDVPGQAALARVPLAEPRRGSKQLVGKLLEDSRDAAALLASLRQP